MATVIVKQYSTVRYTVLYKYKYAVAVVTSHGHEIRDRVAAVLSRSLLLGFSDADNDNVQYNQHL